MFYIIYRRSGNFHLLNFRQVIFSSLEHTDEAEN